MYEMRSEEKRKRVEKMEREKSKLHVGMWGYVHVLFVYVHCYKY